MGELFEPWYLRRHPRVIGTLAAMCGDTDLSAEATDEAFARALARWDRVGNMDSPDAWVTKVAVNELKRRLRRRSLEDHLLRRQRVSEEVPAIALHPEVWAAVRDLPDRQRLAIVLRYVADFDESSIGAVMGIARGTVAASLHAARATLADALGDLGPEHPCEPIDGPNVYVPARPEAPDA